MNSELRELLKEWDNRLDVADCLNNKIRTMPARIIHLFQIELAGKEAIIKDLEERLREHREMRESMHRSVDIEECLKPIIGGKP